MSYLLAPPCDHACETPRKRTAPALALSAALLLLWAVPAAAQTEPAPPETPVEEVHAPDEAHAAEAHEGEEHHANPLETVARLFNFAILAGTLVYLLRSPIAGYLGDRSTQIRGALVNAEETKRVAAAQIQEIDRRMQALPGELEALRAQGVREIAAEEGRIRAAAAAERERLIEQARREIGQQVKIAERELVTHAADLAVALAAQRIKSSITDDDQRRLADRYVQQLTPSSRA